MAYIKILFFCLLCHVSAYGSISIVYNLKIAETTKRQDFEKNGEHPSTAAITGFNQFRTKYSGSRHNYGGSLLSYIYSPENYYARVDWAVAQVNVDGGSFKKGQTDDLLFSAGYSHAFNHRSKCTLSGLFGMPTHKDLSILEPQFGYAHVGLGAQLDASFLFSQYSNDHSLRCAARIIHLFKRRVDLLCNAFDFTMGNLIDLYVALHITSGNSRCDVGYNPTFLCSGKIIPYLTDVVQKSNFKRNSFFGVYKYKFRLGSYPSSVALALSYGFDYESRVFGNKRIITAWSAWTFSF